MRESVLTRIKHITNEHKNNMHNHYCDDIFVD